MANPEHLAILKQGVKVWNEWREKNPAIVPNLGKADLSGSEFAGIDLRRAELTQASFVGANLCKASFVRANAILTYFPCSQLIEADFTRANLFGANLSEANLRKANLGGTSLIMPNVWLADFGNARVGWTIFGDVDLSTAKNLETVTHEGPSTIGIDTIYRSGGEISEVFLRGCGAPDEIIELNRSLSEKSSLYYRCFISHSGKDKRFFERLYADLQAKGVRVWYLPEDAKWDEPVWGEIDRSIKIYDKLIVVCSRNSLTSGPVLREIERALNREDNEHKNIQFPVALDNFIFEEWEHPRKADVLAKVVGDFRGWKRSAVKYDAAFKKLLKALKAE